MTASGSRAGASTGLARKITTAFYAKELNLSERPGHHEQGWPEARTARRLQAEGISATKLQPWLTFTTALDRARNAAYLWRRSAELRLSGLWVSDPQVIVDRGIPPSHPFSRNPRPVSESTRPATGQRAGDG